jgi:long-subunit acyl-CoA synthetase (AMP-forming)
VAIKSCIVLYFVLLLLFNLLLYESTKGGWYKSGDIARIDDDGNVYLIDRKKNIFKLAQGEYVAFFFFYCISILFLKFSPERMEDIYLHSNYIDQVFVYGEPEWIFTVAMFVF